VHAPLLGRNRLHSPARRRRRAPREHLVAAKDVLVPVVALVPDRVHGVHHRLRRDHACAAKGEAHKLGGLFLLPGGVSTKGALTTRRLRSRLTWDSVVAPTNHCSWGSYLESMRRVARASTQKVSLREEEARGQSTFMGTELRGEWRTRR